MSAADAGRLGFADGEIVRVRTRRGSAEVPVEVTDMMQPGHISLRKHVPAQVERVS